MVFTVKKGTVIRLKQEGKEGSIFMAKKADESPAELAEEMLFLHAINLGSSKAFYEDLKHLIERVHDRLTGEDDDEDEDNDEESQVHVSTRVYTVGEDGRATRVDKESEHKVAANVERIHQLEKALRAIEDKESPEARDMQGEIDSIVSAMIEAM
jgi:hypothetical protein